MVRNSQTKRLASASLFVWWNEAFPYGNIKQPSAMKTITLMKCAYGTIRNALLHKFAKRICIMAAKPPLHICKANASFTKLKVYAILNLKVDAIMRDDKLSVQSMDFAVSIINLVKELKLKKKISSPTKSAEAVHPSVLISVKHNTLKVKQTLYQNFK